MSRNLTTVLLIEPSCNGTMKTAPPAQAGAGVGVPLLFALTLFVGASLLFCVQPMVAKMILPLLGGSPSVWNTCMVFFQAALLAGYAYAHGSTARLGVRRQALAHLIMLGLPIIVLPIAVSAESARALVAGANPSGWLLMVLTLAVGLPFFVVATTAPLLQAWFARTGHPSSRDPYFLYAASNLGSMLALLSYPLLIEPNLRLADQSLAWTAGYALLAVLIAACALTLWRTEGGLPVGSVESPDSVERSRPDLRTRAAWVALAFVPSSLLLGVTTYLSTDIAAIPLLWVIPLALYLLTFILAFSTRRILPRSWVASATRIAIVVLVLTLCLGLRQPFWIPIHLAGFFAAAMLCHGELAWRRPDARHLTAFYLAMSLGGVLGGLFNALVAPRVFDGPAEYPLALLLAALALPLVARPVTPEARRRSRRLDLILPIVLAVALGGLLLAARSRPDFRPDVLAIRILFGLAALAWFSFADRPLRFVLGGLALLLASLGLESGSILLRERNFFGVLKVESLEPGPQHRLFHGSTLHGIQDLDPARRREPLTYYHRRGPLGQVVEAFQAGDACRAVAAVGLGTGTMAAYAAPDESWTFYELDPAVVRIARDPRYFTFLEDSRAGDLAVVVGDARLRLVEAPEGGYGLIVLDAFSSDAIPMHLVTREALALYRAKLAERGLIAFHISNRYIDLEPVLGALADDAGLACRVRHEKGLSLDELRSGRSPSSWMVMAASEDDLGSIANDPRWRAPAADPRGGVWTDDSSNLVRHLRLR